ncbi:MAG: hypothetical protein VKJ64_08200 [Leptolyngbyaceae bacterium]|nr:hypothetical protein [Leptolyngbyaceae bacterium]
MGTLSLSRRYFPIFLTAIFLIFGIIGMAHHEMWRDELQAWLIARDSSSLPDLIRNMRYEGHPALWHLLLYVLTRFTHNPIAMQFLHLLIGTLSVFLVAKYSPFTRLQKFLITFGYFSLYEYLVISRNYALGVLLICLTCCLYPQRFQRPFLFLFILGLLANTSFHSWIISVSWAIAFVIEYRFGSGNDLSIKHRKYLPSMQLGFILGSIFYLIAIITAFLLVRPPQDRYRGVGGVDLQPNFEHFLRSISAIWRSYFPLSQFQEQFWSSNFLVGRIGSDIHYLSQGIALVMVLIILGLVATTLFKLSKTSLLIYGLGTSLLFAFTYAKFLGGLRHHGHFYILLLACVWIALLDIKPKKIPKKIDVGEENGKDKRLFFQNTDHRAKVVQMLFTLLLSVQFLATLWPYATDLRLPFTMNQIASQYLADYIQNYDRGELIVAGYQIPSTSAFSARLNIPLYYPQMKSYGSFMIWTKEYNQEIEDKEIFRHLAELILQREKDCVLISDEKIGLKPFRDSAYQDQIKVSLLEEFTGSIVESEHFFIYGIQRRNMLVDAP